MPFPVTQSLTDQEDSIKAKLLEVSATALTNYPAIRGVVFWRDALMARHNGDEAKQSDFDLFIRNMMPVVGNPYKTIKLSDPENVTNVTQVLVEKLLESDISTNSREAYSSIEAICLKIPAYKKLTSSEKELLLDTCMSYRNLSEVDFVNADAPLPGTLTPYSYLGRRIAQAFDPKLTAFYVSLLGPFTRTLKNIEALLRDPKRNVISVKYNHHSQDEDRGEQDTNIQIFLKGITKLNELHFATIPKTAVIDLPRLPAFDLDSLPKKQLDVVVTDFFEWFFGYIEEPTCEVAIRKFNVQVVEDEASKKGADGEKSKANAKAPKETLVASEKEEPMSNWFATSAIEDEMEPFISAVKNAISRGEKIIFTNLSCASEETIDHSILWQALSRGWSMDVSDPSTSNGIKALNQCKFILDQRTLERIKQDKPKPAITKIDNTTFQIVIDSDIFGTAASEIFPIDEDEFDEDEDDSSDSKYSSGALYAYVRTLLMELSGGESDDAKSVLEVLRLDAGKKNLSTDEIIIGLLEYVPTLHVSCFVNFVAECREYRTYDLPEKAWTIAKKRAGLTEGQINVIKKSLTQYQPTSYDTETDAVVIPYDFSELISDPLYFSGWDRITENFLECLDKERIVCLVDDTNYKSTEADNVANSVASDESGDIVVELGSAEKSQALNRSLATTQIQANLFRKLFLGEVPKHWQHTNLFVINDSQDQLNAFEAEFAKLLTKGQLSSRDISHPKELLTIIAAECPDAILCFEVDPNIDESQYSKFLSELSGIGIRLVVISKKSIPGIKEFRLNALGEKDFHEDLVRENENIFHAFGLKPLQPELIKQISATVFRQLPPNTDPMHFAKVIISKASAMTIGRGELNITGDILQDAIGQTFNLPSIRTVQNIRARLDQFRIQAKSKILGQDEAIDRIVDLVIDHMVGARPDTKPLSLLLPGPTGVGKTETVIELMKYLGLKVMVINGSQYAEEHTVSRLSGSPTGYVGPDEGVLYEFLKENPHGFVFIDEYDKLHPVVRKFLMELSDKGMMTAGNGNVVQVPGITVIAATNAGAKDLHPGLTDREIFDILAGALKNGGEDVPELVARFEVIPYFGIDEDSLHQLVKKSFYLQNDLRLMSSRGIQIVSVDDEIIEKAFISTKNLCSMKQQTKTLGFRAGDASFDEGARYCNLRRVAPEVKNTIKDTMSKIKTAAIDGKIEHVKIKLYINDDKNIDWAIISDS